MKINIKSFLSPQSIPDNENILYYKKEKILPTLLVFLFANKVWRIKMKFKSWTRFSNILIL